MPHIVLNPIISPLPTGRNVPLRYNRKSPLILCNRYTPMGNAICQLLITITAGFIDFTSTKVTNATLRLPFLSMSPRNFSFTNTITFRSRNTSYTSSLTISESSFSQGCMFLPISDLIKNWNSRMEPTLELIVSIKYPSLFIRLPNQGVMPSTLSIEYEAMEIPPTNTPSMNTPSTNHYDVHYAYPTVPINNSSTNEPAQPETHRSILSLLATNHKRMLVPKNDAFLFDSILCNHNFDYRYNSKTGIFTFPNIGDYYIQWVIDLQGSCTLGCIGTGIRNESTGDIIDFHTPCVLPLQLCGQHIIHVDNTSDSYTLINDSDSTVQLAATPTQASLIIFEL